MINLQDVAQAVRALTEDLVRRPSINQSPDEYTMGAYVADWLRAAGVEVHTQEIAADPYPRLNAYGLVRGRSPQTVVMLAHFDTVGIDDFGVFRAAALDPRQLKEMMQRYLSEPDGLDPALRRDLLAEQELGREVWLMGRGASDMKSGLATGMVVLQHLARQPQTGNVILLAVPDEENLSAGVLQAVYWLDELRQLEGLEYVGAINLDYISDLPGEGEKIRPVVYDGTVGKLLVSLYVRGVTGHAGDPLGTVDPNLALAEMLRDISRDERLVELDTEWVVPPVVLHQGDLKTQYDTQTPLEAAAQINFILRQRTPAEILAHVREIVAAAYARSLTESRQRRAAWQKVALPHLQPTVLTLAELMARAEARPEPPTQRSVIGANLDVVRSLWNHAHLHGPGAVVYADLPFYPAVKHGLAGRFSQAVHSVAGKFGLEIKPFYPYITDSSYVGAIDTSVTASMSEAVPLTASADMAKLRDRYWVTRSLDLPPLNLPVFTLGPFGRGAHTPWERVYMPYAFETLPHLLFDVIQTTLGD
jgi:arginine utilization protein RocB